jgi:hypothetical protein
MIRYLDKEETGQCVMPYQTGKIRRIGGTHQAVSKPVPQDDFKPHAITWRYPYLCRSQGSRIAAHSIEISCQLDHLSGWRGIDPSGSHGLIEIMTASGTLARIAALIEDGGRRGQTGESAWSSIPHGTPQTNAPSPVRCPGWPPSLRTA